jgi:hypothetical protein
MLFKTDYFEYLCPGLVDTFLEIPLFLIRGWGRKEVFEVVKN